jgi:hypothetical protein
LNYVIILDCIISGTYVHVFYTEIKVKDRNKLCIIQCYDRPFYDRGIRCSQKQLISCTLLERLAICYAMPLVFAVLRTRMWFETFRGEVCVTRECLGGGGGSAA